MKRLLSAHLSEHDMRLSRALGVIAFCLGVTACGGAQAPMEIVRPPLLSVAEFGSTVSVAPFEAAWPDFGQIAGTMKRELERAVEVREGQGVKLKPYGGGLVVHGVVERYSMSFSQLVRAASCEDEVASGSPVKRSCRYHRLRWKVWVSIQMRVRSSEGKLLYQRRVQEIREGMTPEVRDAVPTPPNLHAVLKRLRQRVVARMARVITPQRRRVLLTLRPCVGAALPWCAKAEAHFAASCFAASLADYDRGERSLRREAGTENSALADIHWNRSLVARYGRDYGRAIDELEMGQRLKPGDPFFSQAIDEASREQREDGWLIDLGLSSLPPPRQP